MKMRRIAVLALSIFITLGMMSVFAVDTYDYNLSISGGNGTIAGTLPDTITSIEPVTGEDGAVIVNGESHKVTPPEKHFVTGIKIAGQDNVKDLIVGKVTLEDKDVDYVVTYGLKSQMTEYTVRFVATDGGFETVEETHYGIIGEKPIITAKFFDGYVPAALNQSKTIEENTVIQFNYYAVDTEGNIIVINDGAAAGGGAAGGAAGAGAGAGAGAAAAGAPGAVIGDGGVPLADAPADIVDLDTPTTDQAGDGDGTDVDGTETPKAGLSTPVKVAGVAAIIAAIAALVAAIARRNAGGEDDEEEDEE